MEKTQIKAIEATKKSRTVKKQTAKKLPPAKTAAAKKTATKATAKADVKKINTVKAGTKKTATAKTSKKDNGTKKPQRITIREARSDADYHLAYPIIHQLFPHLDMQTYARRVFVARATGYRMFVAMLGREMIGVIGIMHNHNIHDGFVTYIEHVVVEESHRGQGYGAHLINFAENRARDEGCNLLELDTDIGATHAENLYQRNGFRRSGSYFYKNINQYKDTYPYI